MKTNESIREVDTLVMSRGYKCLSIYYKNNSAPMWFKCDWDHVFQTPLKSLKKTVGVWCPKCRRNPPRKLRNAARRMGGNCFERKWRGPDYLYTWRCKNGHEWKATYRMVNAKHWCPRCDKKEFREGRYFIENRRALNIVKHLFQY